MLPREARGAESRWGRWSFPQGESSDQDRGQTIPGQVGCGLEAQGEWPLPCTDPPTEPSAALELHEALFSWDPVGTSQETFISHLEVKKVRWSNALGESPD